MSCNFLNGNGKAQDIHPRSAIFFWYRDPHEAKLCQLFAEIKWKFSSFISMGRTRFDFRYDKLPNHVSNHLMIFVEFKIHEFSLRGMNIFFDPIDDGF